MQDGIISRTGKKISMDTYYMVFKRLIGPMFFTFPYYPVYPLSTNTMRHSEKLLGGFSSIQNVFKKVEQEG
jgi:hypothetical protein